MIILLLVSVALAIYLEDQQGAVVLSIIIVVNTIIGYTQEAKAENVLKSLQTMLLKTAKVRRDRKLIEVPVEKVVPGDIVYIEEGESIPADLRLIECMNLKTNDFSLT